MLSQMAEYPPPAYCSHCHQCLPCFNGKQQQRRLHKSEVLHRTSYLGFDISLAGFRSTCTQCPVCEGTHLAFPQQAGHSSS